MNLTLNQLKHIIYKRLQSRRFACVLDQTRNTIGFKLVYRSNPFVPINSGTITLLTNGNVLFKDQTSEKAKEEPVTICSNKELIEELFNFYKNTTKKSLGIFKKKEDIMLQLTIHAIKWDNGRDYEDYQGAILPFYFGTFAEAKEYLFSHAVELDIQYNHGYPDIPSKIAEGRLPQKDDGYTFDPLKKQLNCRYTEGFFNIITTDINCSNSLINLISQKTTVK